jgi:hypothetical protein
MGHSGKLRIAMATRSPFRTPKSVTRACANAEAAAWCSAKVDLSSS